MKKTRYKACLLIGELDDDMILEAELSEPTLRAGRHGSRYIVKRLLVIAACVAVLAVATVALLLPTMRREEPTIPPPEEESHTVTESPTESPAALWVSDPTMVRVERIAVRNEEGEADPEIEGVLTEDGFVSVQTQAQTFSDQLILIHFSCRENEHITVETSSARGVLNPVYLYTTEKNGVTRSYWRFADESFVLSESFDYEQYEDTSDRSVTVGNGDVVLWQYANLALPCVEDNFVDFTVTDDEGHITGVGSIYIGGYDLTDISENKTYYGKNPSGGPRGFWVSFVYTNAFYRPVVLGSYRYADVEGADGTTGSQCLQDLHDRAHEAREALFADLDGELLRLSVREALIEYAQVIQETNGVGLFSFNLYASEMRYLIMYFVNSTDPADHEHLLFLYDGTYQRIISWDVYLQDEYGRMVAGCLYLEDGTVVQVDKRDTDQPVTVLPPSNTETV